MLPEVPAAAPLLRCLLSPDTRRGGHAEGSNLPQSFRETVEPPHRHEGDTRKRHKAQPQECALASGRQKGGQITLVGRNQRRRFYTNFSLFPQFQRPRVSRFFSPVRLNVIHTYHQSLSPTLSLSLSSIQKCRLISTQYLSHACYMPDNIQGAGECKVRVTWFFPEGL